MTGDELEEEQKSVCPNYFRGIYPWGLNFA